MAANPSLDDLYRALEWFEAHDPHTNTRIFSYFTIAIGVLCCLIALFKVLAHASNPWRSSPIVVALLLLHLFGSVGFDRIAGRGDKSWISPPEIPWPFHTPVKYSGPASYALFLILWEETFIFFNPSQNAKARGYMDAATFLVKVYAVTSSISFGVFQLQRVEFGPMTEDTVINTPVSFVSTMGLSFGLAGFIIAVSATFSSILPDVVAMLISFTFTFEMNQEDQEPKLSPVDVVDSVDTTEIKSDKTTGDLSISVTIQPLKEEHDIEGESVIEEEKVSKVPPEEVDAPFVPPAIEENADINQDIAIAPEQARQPTPPLDPTSPATPPLKEETADADTTVEESAAAAATATAPAVSAGSSPHASPRQTVRSTSDLTRPVQPSSSRRNRTVEHGIVTMWSGISSFNFETDDFLRKGAPCDLLKAEDVLLFAELGKYLLHEIPRGNRAETTSASTVVFRLEQSAKDAKDPSSPVFVSKGNMNYFRSCLWLGQAFLTVFPQNRSEHVVHEIPIEAIIKASGYSPDGFKTVGMLPEPKETWRQYLERMENPSDEQKSDVEMAPTNLPPGQQSKGAESKKIKEVHGWIERFLGGRAEFLDREVPRAEGWDSGVPLDINRILYRHLQNQMLLPPYDATIMDALAVFKEKKTKSPLPVEAKLDESPPTTDSRAASPSSNKKRSRNRNRERKGSSAPLGQATHLNRQSEALE